MPNHPLTSSPANLNIGGGLCHPIGSRPPLPPVSGASRDSFDLKLTAADGNHFMAFVARAGRPTGGGMVILPDIRGLHDFYRELALRCAEVGFDSIAIDYYGRTADTDKRDESFDNESNYAKATPEGVTHDVVAATEYLRGPGGGNPASIFTLGCCFGGVNSWRQSASGLGFAGCIGFYGGRPMERIAKWIPEMNSPILMLLAGIDHTSQEEYQEYADKVRAVGVEVESHTYAGAPHSFFDSNYHWLVGTWSPTAHKEACDDAWRRLLAFTARHSSVTATAQ